MTRLAVTADIHCDDFGSKVDPATGLNARWVDTVAMLRWVARDAQARGADALIVAGDFTEARHPAPWRVAMIREALEAFEGERFLLRGNHDGLRGGRWIGDVLSNDQYGWNAYSEPDVAMVDDTAIGAGGELRSLPPANRKEERAMSGREHWIAGPDGIAHLERGRAARAECGAAATGEQHSWPTRRRCLECLSRQATSSLPEELLLAGYGVGPRSPIGE